MAVLEFKNPNQEEKEGAAFDITKRTSGLKEIWDLAEDKDKDNTEDIKGLLEDLHKEASQEISSGEDGKDEFLSRIHRDIEFLTWGVEARLLREAKDFYEKLEKAAASALDAAKKKNETDFEKFEREEREIWDTGLPPVFTEEQRDAIVASYGQAHADLKADIQIVKGSTEQTKDDKDSGTESRRDGSDSEAEEDTSLDELIRIANDKRADSTDRKRALDDAVNLLHEQHHDSQGQDRAGIELRIADLFALSQKLNGTENGGQEKGSENNGERKESTGERESKTRDRDKEAERGRLWKEAEQEINFTRDDPEAVVRTLEKRLRTINALLPLQKRESPRKRKEKLVSRKAFVENQLLKWKSLAEAKSKAPPSIKEHQKAEDKPTASEQKTEEVDFDIPETVPRGDRGFVLTSARRMLERFKKNNLGTEEEKGNYEKIALEQAIEIIIELRNEQKSKSKGEQKNEQLPAELL